MGNLSSSLASTSSSSSSSSNASHIYYSTSSVHAGVAAKLIKLMWPHAQVHPHSFVLAPPALEPQQAQILYIATDMPEPYISCFTPSSAAQCYWIFNRTDGGSLSRYPASMQSRMLCSPSESLITLVWYTLLQQSSTTLLTTTTTTTTLPPLAPTPALSSTLLGDWAKKQKEKEKDACENVTKAEPPNENEKEDAWQTPDWLNSMLDNGADIFTIDADARRAEQYLLGGIQDFAEFERRLGMGSLQNMADEQERLMGETLDQEAQIVMKAIESEKDGEIVTDSGERIPCKTVTLETYAHMKMVTQQFYKVETTNREDEEFRVPPETLLVMHVPSASFYCITRSEHGTRIMSRLATALEKKGAWTSPMAPLCVFMEKLPC